MKVYIVLAYDQYYPTGTDDIKGVYLDLDSAYEAAREYGGYFDYSVVREEDVIVAT